MKHELRVTADNHGYAEFDFNDGEWAEGFGVFLEIGYTAENETGEKVGNSLVELPRKKARKLAKAILKATKK